MRCVFLSIILIVYLQHLDQLWKQSAELIKYTYIYQIVTNRSVECTKDISNALIKKVKSPNKVRSLNALGTQIKKRLLSNADKIIIFWGYIIICVSNNSKLSVNFGIWRTSSKLCWLRLSISFKKLKALLT